MKKQAFSHEKAGKKQAISHVDAIKVLGFAALAFLAFWRREPLTMANKQSRAIQFAGGLGYYYTGNVKISTVKLPMVSYAHYQPSEAADIKAKLDKIERQYGGIIAAAGGVTRVPTELIKAFIYIESEGEERAVSRSGAIGLMQLIPDTAVFVVALEKIKGRLTQYEHDWLSDIIGKRQACIMKMRNLGDEVICENIRKNKFITREDLFNPHLNILIGSIFLGILLDESEENGVFRLDKVAVRYNMGYNYKKKGKELVGSPNKMLDLLPAEPKSFVKKLVGPNGLLTMV